MKKDLSAGTDFHMYVLIQISSNCYLRCKIVDIIALWVRDKYIDIYIMGREKPVQVPGPLQPMEEKLFPFYFRRTHKSCIIGLRHLVFINKETVLLSQRIEVPLQACYRKSLTCPFTILN